MVHPYEKELVKREILRVCAHYAPGEPQTSGGRTTFVCPGCSKPNLAANHHQLKAGCWSPNCPVPDYVDALSLIAHFEGLDIRRDFKEILARGYEILDLRPDAGTEREAESSSPGRPPEVKPGRASETDDYSASRPPEGRSPSPTGGSSGQATAAAGPEHEPENTAGEAACGDLGTGENVVAVGAETEKEREAGSASLRNAPGFGPPAEHGHSAGGLRAGAEAPVFGNLSPPRQAGSPELLDAVYGRILELCPAEERDHKFWDGRGVSRETVQEGRFGSITKKRAAILKERLPEEFSIEDLLSVPGFSTNRSGGLSFTLSGDYALIPYHDAGGRITTIEGRAVGRVPEGMGKYVSLSGAGSHLYVFPGFSPERLEAFCEGPIGAIVAAQSGIAVGAIQGFRRYRSSQSSLADGKSGEPLLELRGADFGGRRVPYIPDLDQPPKPEVIEEAPVAARWLVEEQNGEGALVALPRGKDLDEWLLTLDPHERRPAFDALVGRATPLSTVLEERRQRERLRRGRSTESVETEVFVANDSHARSSEGREEPAGGSSQPAGGGDGEHAGGASRKVTVKRTPAEPPEHPRRSPPEWPLERQKAVRERRAERSRRLADAAHRELLGGCPPTDHHRALWRRLGVGNELLEAGLFASVSGRRVFGLCARLAGSFGKDRLLKVAGFEEDPKSGKVRFALLAGAEPSAELALVPCMDPEGRISGLLAFPTEGRSERSVKFAGPLRVVRDGTDHLWLPPGGEEPEAICESPLAAIAAAARGLRVAAIAGPGRYRSAAGEDTLPELRGVDFSGGRVLYVPGFENGAERRSMQESVSAARRLIARHGGEAAIIPRLPSGESFGRWVAGLPAEGGTAREVFEELKRSAVPLPETEEEVFGHQITRRQAAPAESRASEPEKQNGTRPVHREPARDGSRGGTGIRQRPSGRPDASLEANPRTMYSPPEMPSAATITAGELWLSLSGAVAVFALVYAGAEILTNFFEELASLERYALELSLLLSVLAALWLWNARSARRRFTRRMLGGDIDH